MFCAGPVQSVWWALGPVCRLAGVAGNGDVPVPLMRSPFGGHFCSSPLSRPDRDGRGMAAAGARGMSFGAMAGGHWERASDSRGEVADGPAAGDGHRPGGWCGQPPGATDGGPGQGRRSVRRPLPADGLCPVQSSQRRVPAHLRPHPVQEPQPGPAHHDHLAAERPARRLCDTGAGPAAARAALANRLGGRDPPVAEPDLRRAAGSCGRVRRRPRVPDGPDADDRSACCRGRRRHGRSHPRTAPGGNSLRGDPDQPGRAHGRGIRGEAGPPAAASRQRR